MIHKILARKQTIFSDLKDKGLDFNNVEAILLTGSYFWGYADESESDVDLILIEKEWTEREPIFMDDVNIEVFTHVSALKENMKKSNWGKYYLTQFCSYPLFGEAPTLKFDHSHIANDFKRKREFDVDTIPGKGVKAGFHAVMKRVFFLNYLKGRVTFRLTDFVHCEELSQDEKVFLEDCYVTVFNKVNSSKKASELRDLALSLEELIASKV